MATISDVAELAGVSKGTVSAVLNNRKDGPIKVSPETWEKVLAAAAELSYVPNTAAKGLRTGKTYLAGVIAGEIANSFASEILDGIEDALNEQNYNIILVKNKCCQDILGKCHFLNEKKVDGLIVISNMYENYAGYFDKIKFDKPTVFIANDVKLPNAGSVSVDGYEIGLLAAEHLIGLGHEKIAVAELQDSDRMKGIKEAFCRHGIRDPEITMLAKYSSFEDGRKAVEEILAKHPQTTAVIAHSDIVASGIIYEAREKGIKVPEQLSVVGTDNIEMSKMLYPALSTVHQPKTEQGTLAAKLLLEMMNGASPRNLRLKPEMIVRKSSAAPRKEGEIS